MKPGKGAAFVRTKMRNYITGNTVEKTFRAGATVKSFELKIYIPLSLCADTFKSYINLASADTSKNIILVTDVAVDIITAVNLL